MGRLLLDPAGVGEHRRGVGLEREEVEVADRIDQRQPRAAAGAEHLPGPGMNREDDRDQLRDTLQRRDRLAEQGTVDERRAGAG